MSKLIIVSNRLPYSIKGNKITQSSGGLVSAIKSYIELAPNDKFDDCIWVGAGDFSESKWNAIKPDIKQSLKIKIKPVFIPKNLEEGYYNGFSNSTLWPLFHYFPTYTEYNGKHYESYKSVNKIFAEAIDTITEEGDVIWVHDYHLMLVPKLIKSKQKANTIGFFLHIPFPSYEIMRLIPKEWGKELLEGVGASDLIGFHTNDYLRHFNECLQVIAGIKIEDYQYIHHKDHLAKIDVFPIGIDYEKFNSIDQNEKVINIHSKIKSEIINKKIIFSIDRLDYTKGLIKRLEGFERFLEKYPEWREKVVFILGLVPSRDIISKYKDRKKTIEQNISRINGLYGSIVWQPIMYRYQHLEFEELNALYYAADLALITPLRDGMNLVAKEFIAAKNNNPGVLVLSDMTGAAHELGEAILINPNDLDEMADGINQGLSMDKEEQLERLHTMQSRISNYNVVTWVNHFILELEQIKHMQEELEIKKINEEKINQINTDFKNAKKKLLLFDYDGTLVPFAKQPHLAIPTENTYSLLNALSQKPNTDIYIISGRDSEFLNKYFKNLPIGLISEHGANIKRKGGNWLHDEKINTLWKTSVMEVMNIFAQRTPGAFVEEKQFAVAWHYRNSEKMLGKMRSKELLGALLAMSSNSEFHVVDGNHVIEVRASGVDKGTAAQTIANEVNYDFIFCIGDDKTDEDMFKMLRNRANTIKVGLKNSFAEYNIESQESVETIITKLFINE